MSEKSRELYETFLKEYIENGYLHSGCLDFDVNKKEEFEELKQLGLIQLRKCEAFAYELTKTERKILVKNYNLEVRWIKKASHFMVNGKFEELETLK